MNDKVIDIEQRKQALDPAQSFIVQAPAGSGKTELLIQRYLGLLAYVENPEEIIAITFTRKAAAEMQGRIVKAMERARQKPEPKADATRVTDELAVKVIEQDNKHNWNLEKNPSRLRIQTIDSLCAYLTRQMPMLSHFGAQPETLEDASELYQQAAQAALAELDSNSPGSNAIAVLLTHLDNDLPKARNMLATMLARRDQWLRHVQGELARTDLEGALKHIVETELAIIHKQFPENLTDELIQCLQFAAANLQQEQSTSGIVACHGIKQLPGKSCDDLPAWQGIVEFLFTRTNQWRKQANANLGFPPASGNKAESEQRKAMKDRYAALLSQLSETEALRQQLENIACLPPVHYSENEWQVIEALCQLLLLADDKLRDISSERNQVDFTGVMLSASKALGASEDPSDLAMHLDYKIKHILVDEFQDISINQFKLLESLTAGWSPGDGHSLFLVGDPMQSIYRFREAEVGLFINTWQQQRLDQVPLVPISISVNFRSNRAIVDWINSSFAEIFPAQADVSRGAVCYEAAVAFHEQAPDQAVTVHALLENDHAVEAARVVDIITQLKQQDKPGKTAILVRNRSHLHDIVTKLKQAKLRYRAVEIEALGHRPAVQDLLALTLALTHLSDRIAWLACLRAPWCGLSLADLIALVGNDKDSTVWECIEHNRKKLSKAGQTRLQKFQKVIQRAYLEQHRRPLRRWVQSVWIRLGGPATLPEETDLENAFNFFQLLDQFDDNGFLKQRQPFIDKVETLYASPDVSADDSLQIMTIHKAKGLEFDNVILPGLARGTATDEARLLIWSENPHAMHEDLLLAPIKETGQQEAPIYRYLRRLEQQKQSLEEQRLLYVATTRAKQQLHIVATATVKEVDGEPQIAPPRSNSLLDTLWPIVKDHFESLLDQQATGSIKQAEPETATAKQIRRLDARWTHPIPPAAVPWLAEQKAKPESTVPDEIEFIWAGETIKHIGTVTHRAIQQIAEQGVETWDQARIQSLQKDYEYALQRLGVPANELTSASARVIEALCNIIADERGQWLLFKGYEIQHNEYAISGMQSGKLVNAIIDRTFVDDDNVRWIVDYKTSRHEGTDLDNFLDREQERYQDQLKKYAVLMSRMDKRKIKLGLYFPLLKGWREWEYTDKQK